MRTWKLAVPGLALLAGCAAFERTDEPPLAPVEPLPPPPAATTYLPGDRPPAAVTLEKPAPPGGVPVKQLPPPPEPKVIPAKAELPTLDQALAPALPTAGPLTRAPDPTQPLELPAPLAASLPAAPLAASLPAAPLAASPAAPAKVLPVSIDAVLRLAEGQNVQVVLARERIRQACAEQDVAAKALLPAVNVGVGYWRHEGGIQLQEGPLIRSSTQALLGGLDVLARLDVRAAAFARLDAERKLLQQKGDLRRVTTEVLLEATATYIDLLAAHSGLAIARELDGELRKLLDRAERLANVERGARVEVVRIQAEINGQAQTVRRLEAQAKAAAAKLAYLLGLDPGTDLVPVDEQLVAFRLVDVTQPADALVAQVVAQGPGLRELEGILAVIQQGISEAEGPNRWLPVFEARALEGAFAAGPNDRLDWANRLDLGVQARWNLTELFTAKAQKRVARSLMAQTQLTHADVRAKLALAVREARETALSGEQEMTLATEQILRAKEAANLSDLRLTEGIAGASFSEVLLSRKAVAGAQAGYLGVLREFDKAQLRLLVLAGAPEPR
jgi:outer membrane protein TolC